MPRWLTSRVGLLKCTQYTLVACFGPPSSRTDCRSVDANGKRVAGMEVIHDEIDLGSHIRGLLLISPKTRINRVIEQATWDPADSSAST